jgi:hypothetical protein
MHFEEAECEHHLTEDNAQGQANIELSNEPLASTTGDDCS